MCGGASDATRSTLPKQATEQLETTDGQHLCAGFVHTQCRDIFHIATANRDGAFSAISDGGGHGLHERHTTVQLTKAVVSTQIEWLTFRPESMVAS